MKDEIPLVTSFLPGISSKGNFGILSLRKVKGGTSTDLISTRDLSTGHRFNHVGHHRDGNEEASHVVKHLLSGSLQSFSFNLFGFSFLSF